MLTIRSPATFDNLPPCKGDSPNLNDDFEPYRSLTILKKLSNTKFPVFLVSSKLNKQYYAMKVFPFVDGHPHQHFYNEARFTFLRHPNIVNFLYFEKEKGACQKDEIHQVSYILMDYASRGDFFGFIIRHRDQFTEKLARTYFRQLIEGVEYLHKNGIAHLDLKPENLLLNDDFNLKIIDFDRSYIQGDAKILSRGTKFYRAPEYFRTAHTEITTTYPADIYSAGVILFILKSGGVYPHGEDDSLDSGSFLDLLYNDNNRFWEGHHLMEKRTRYFYGQNFKELFNGMVHERPEDRLSLSQIKQSKWYNGPVYSAMELRKKMEEIIIQY